MQRVDVARAETLRLRRLDTMAGPGRDYRFERTKSLTSVNIRLIARHNLFGWPAESVIC